VCMIEKGVEWCVGRKERMELEERSEREGRKRREGEGGRKQRVRVDKRGGEVGEEKQSCASHLSCDFSGLLYLLYLIQDNEPAPPARGLSMYMLSFVRKA